jgi:anti-sigma factor RsiW
MDCSDVRLRLPGLRLGELSAADRDSIEAHLVSCEACRAEARENGRSISRLLADATEERARFVPPTDLEAVVRQAKRLQGAGPRGARRGTLLRAARGLAGSLARGAARRATLLAAVLLAGLGLAAILGMKIRAHDGTLTVAFALPGSSLPDAGRPLAPLSERAEPVVAPLVRDEVEGALAPAFRDLAAWMVASEERHARELALIARWLDERRIENASELATALAATRADLRVTQEAVFAVANHIPVPSFPR